MKSNLIRKNHKIKKECKLCSKVQREKKESTYRKPESDII